MGDPTRARAFVATRTRIAQALGYVFRYICSAPLTFTWLAILFVTTVVQHSVSEQHLTMILGERSTNIAHLSADPVHVLITSLLWVDGYYWLPYLVLFCIFLAPAERWLGPGRWLSIGLAAHVIATLFSEELLHWAIEHGHAPEAMVNVRDIGVSYFLAGMVGVLTFHVAYPWRWAYAAGMVAFFTVPLTTDLSFTAVGHASAFLIGMACYPLTRARHSTPWNPVARPLRWWHQNRRPLGSS